MRRSARLRRHITYANVCATLALFIAVSTGGAVAKSNLIDGRSIKPNSIPAKALQNNSITSAKIKNQQVTALDVKKGSLPPTVLNAETQRKLSGVGQGSIEQTGNGETAIYHNQDGASWEYALIDIVPKGAGLPCRVMNQTYPNGVWEFNGAGAPIEWTCKITFANGSIATSQAAKKGSPMTSGSGAVNT